jgi:hypothetical protein
MPGLGRKTKPRDWLRVGAGTRVVVRRPSRADQPSPSSRPRQCDLGSGGNTGPLLPTQATRLATGWRHGAGRLASSWRHEVRSPDKRLRSPIRPRDLRHPDNTTSVRAEIRALRDRTKPGPLWSAAARRRFPSPLTPIGSAPVFVPRAKAFQRGEARRPRDRPDRHDTNSVRAAPKASSRPNDLPKCQVPVRPRPCRNRQALADCQRANHYSASGS